MFLFNSTSVRIYSCKFYLNTSYVSIQCYENIHGTWAYNLFKYILCFYSMAAERYLYATWRPFKYILCFYSIERGVPVHNAPLNLNTSYVSIQLSPLRTAEYPVLFKYILCFYSILLVLLLPSAYPI